MIAKGWVRGENYSDIQAEVDKSKLSSSIDIRNAFFSEVGIGISANTILLLFHVHTFLHEHRLKPTDLTISHLALIHIVMLVTMGFIGTDILGSQKTWYDIKCKIVLYLYRLMRGLSICTTCLLSVLQAITLSPRNSCLAKFKHKSSHHNLHCFLLLWVFNMSISSHYVASTIATPNVCIFLTSDFLGCFPYRTHGPLKWIHGDSLMLVGNGYATISPLVLIRTEKRMAKFLKFT
ncbi:LOW QUALITY PROTEIN: putative vomeronasal receptor-like protein 4 [Megaptera novaeangliae]